MSRTTLHIVDGDLHAFADNYLPADRRASILAALENDPAEGRRVADWCAQNEAIRRILGKTAFEPVPVALSLAGTSRRQNEAGAAATIGSAGEKVMPRPVEPAITQARPKARRRLRTFGRLLMLAVVVGAAGLFGVASGGMVSPSKSPTATRPDANLAMSADAAAFSSRAIEAHRTFATDSQFPVEIGSTQQPRLLQWFEKRLGQVVTIPDLRSTGFVLLGGRLVPGSRGPSAFVLYQNAVGERLGLMFARSDAAGSQTMHYAMAQGTGVMTWAQDGDVLCLSGPADPTRLATMAKVAAKGFNATERR